MHKLINSSRSPEYFREQIIYNSEIHRHKTRSRDEIDIPIPKSQSIQPKTKYGTIRPLSTTASKYGTMETQPDILALEYAGFSRNMKKKLLSQQLSA
jgi:hypothetical protein